MPKIILVSVLFLYHIYIFYSRRIIWDIRFTKKNILIFGQSATIELIKSGITKSKGYKIKEEYLRVPENGKINARNIDFILISSTLFKDDSAAWDIISSQFIHKGMLIKTDFNFFEELFQRTPVEGLNNPAWLLRGISSRRGSSSFEVTLKRFTDIVFALTLMSFCFPVSILIYFLIKFFDRMPPLFSQERAGLLDKRFNIYKFRTMRPGTEKITLLGGILRRFRLDEMPQLINIFKGDLSLVGPRPIWTKEYILINKNINNHAIRSIAKPGLTGWAQLNFKAPPNYGVIEDGHEDFAAAYQRLSYDVWYIKNQSFFLDIEIMLKTAKRMFIKDKYVS
ncbi:lipopolysaccharide/colanic/teichoic acid biosynthesis glycosyltransferase [Elusimicrobium posterum]